jgi:4-hydroxy-tetrahydrodipicolinate reductase
MSKQNARVAVVGLGGQGAGIAALLVKHGYNLVGAIDVGEKVGAPISQFVPEYAGERVVRASVADLVQDKPEIAILAAAIGPEETAAQAAELMRNGVNAITLQPDMLVADPSWAAELDRIGKETGASFLSTGVQDTWWIQFPRIIAGSSCGIREVRIASTVDANDLPQPVGAAIGVGMPADAFADHAKMLAHAPSVLTTPLLESARAMGLTPLDVVTGVEGVTAAIDLEWRSGGASVAAGDNIGITQSTHFATVEGITFYGTLTTALVAGAVRTPDRVQIIGDPDLDIQINNFPGVGVTNAAVLNRLQDVIEAKGGVLTPGGLSPMTYRANV